MATPSHPTPKGDHYRTYKEDTNCVANWLAVTARACGYSSSSAKGQSSHTGGRLKGKARKKASKSAEQSSWVVERNDFPRLAQFIAGAHSPRIDVPASILWLLRRAIRLRKQFSAAFAAASTPDLAESNKTHQHFIQVLEEVFGILRPSCSAAPDVKLEPEESQQDASQSSNSFSSLEVEDLPEEVETPSNAAESLDSTSPRYTAEPSPAQDENLLAAVCILKDMMCLRAFVGHTWLGYRNGIYDLITCALTTHAAIGLMRQLQAEYERDTGNLFDYEKVADLMMRNIALAKGADPSVLSGRSTMEIAIDNWEIASLVMYPYMVLLRSMQGTLREGNWEAIEQFDRFKSPKKGTFLDVPQHHEDRMLLQWHVTDFVLLYSGGHHAVDDRLSVHLEQSIFQGRPLELWGILAGTVSVDIIHVLQEYTVAAFHDLYDTTTGICNAIEASIALEASIDMKTAEADKVTECAREVINTFKLIVLDDPVHTAIKEAAQREQPGYPKTTLGPKFRYLKFNPTYCGLLKLKILSSTHESELSMLNSRGTVKAACHLYNAVQKEGLSHAWPDLDLILAMHGSNQIYVGNPPDNVGSYFKQWFLSMGMSARASAPDGLKRIDMSRKLPKSSRGPVVLQNDAVPICSAFADAEFSGELREGFNAQLLSQLKHRMVSNERHGRICRSMLKYLDDALEICRNKGEMKEDEVERLESVRARSLKDTTTSSARPSKSQSGQDPDMVSTPIAMLTQLRFAIGWETHLLQVDYFGLHERCWKLLRAMRLALQPRILQALGEDPGYGANASEGRRNFDFTGELLGLCKMTNDQAQRRRTTTRSFPFLEEAAKMIDEHVGRDQGAVEIGKMIQNHTRVMKCYEKDLETDRKGAVTVGSEVEDSDSKTDIASLQSEGVDEGSNQDLKNKRDKTGHLSRKVLKKEAEEYFVARVQAMPKPKGSDNDDGEIAHLLTPSAARLWSRREELEASL